MTEYLLLKSYKVQFVQQNGAPSRFSRDVRQYLDKVVPSQWNGRGDAHKIGTTFS